MLNYRAFLCLKHQLKSFIPRRFKSETFQSKLFDYLLDASSPSKVNLRNVQFLPETTLPRSKGENKHFAETSPNVVPLHDLVQKLDELMSQSPSRITTSPSYRNFLTEVESSLAFETMDRVDLLKILFYIGLSKSSPQARFLTSKVLLRLKDCLGYLTVTDICIIANASFKTSSRKLDPVFLQLINDTIRNESSQVLNDPAILVCLTKPLRLNHEFDYDVLKLIASSSGLWSTNFSVVAHMLALFAEAKYQNVSVQENLTHKGLKELQDFEIESTSKKFRYNQRIRAKDISKFLWAVSTLAISISKENIENVVFPLLSYHLEHGQEYKKHPDVLLDSLLSLSFLGHYSEKLMSRITSKDVLKHLLEKKKTQPLVRMQLLQAAIKIERADIHCPPLPAAFCIPVPKVEDHLKNRPGLKDMLHIINCLCPVLGFSSATCKFQVPHLYIAGIELTTQNNLKAVIDIEFLDPTICLLGTSSPTGYMRLKLRLLAQLGRNYILINYKDLPGNTTAQFTYIEDVLRAKLNTRNLH